MGNILFLCTGNSARSILAEAYMNHIAKGEWRAWSAGSTPVGKVNPYALETLAAHGIIAPEGGGRSKSWDEFTTDDAPFMDVIVTVCDNAAGEACPIWPQRKDGSAPRTLHWSFPDPAAIDDPVKKRDAFETLFRDISKRIDAFLTEGA